MSIKAAGSAEWSDCREPMRMIKAVQKTGSLRKLRLVVVAAARLVWEALPEPEMRESVEACERRADGLEEQAVLDEYRSRFYGYIMPGETRKTAEWLQSNRIALSLVFATTYSDSFFRTLAQNNHWKSGAESLRESVNHIIRDIFGNPFRPVAVEPAWLTLDVLALARGIYDDKAFDRMPILADALQDAGCDSEEVLNHCRGDGPHVRGCWVIDLLLALS